MNINVYLTEDDIRNLDSGKVLTRRSIDETHGYTVNIGTGKAFEDWWKERLKND